MVGVGRMGTHHARLYTEIEGAAYIETHVSEHAQLWTYRAWADWMAAESWADLKANHTPSPEGYA